MKSRLGGSIEPFVLCQMDLFEKPGDSLYRLSQVAMQESFLPPGLGRQRNRARHLRAGLLGRANNVSRRGVDDRVVEGLQSDADASCHSRHSL